MHTWGVTPLGARVCVIFGLFSMQVWGFLIFGNGVDGNGRTQFLGQFTAVYRVEGFGEFREAMRGL